MKKRQLGEPAASTRNPPIPGLSFGHKPSWSADPPASDQEIQNVRASCSRMPDRELLDLAAQYGVLLPSSRQAVREEMERRGLGDPATLAPGYDPTDPESMARAEEEIARRLESRRALGGPEQVDYTWMAPLCDYEFREEALQRIAMLNRAGIQSWFRDPDRGRGDPTVQRLDYRILVPADQLEHAQAVIAQPIAQDIIDESKVEVPEYQMPRCPRCQSEDPTLVGTAPSNQWHCESCGNEWSDPVPEPKEA
jgi:hypothetical protein